MDAKFFARDFKGNKLPTSIGEKAIVKNFIGMKNVEVVVTEVSDGFVFAEFSKNGR